MAIQTFTAGQVLTATQVNNLQANDYNQTVNNKTDSYTLVVGDRGTRVVMNKATATTITVNTSIFSAGDTVWIHNIGAGICTITAGTATVACSGSLALLQNQGGTLYFTSASAAIFFPSQQPGLTLLNTTSFSAVTSQSVSDVFSGTYTNYLINLDVTADAFRTITARWRVSGADDSNANYNYQTMSASATTVSGARTTGQTSFIFGYTDNSGRCGITVNVYNPFATQRTATTAHSNLFSSTAIENWTLTSAFANTTSFTGFTLIGSAVNSLTGTVRTYGYNQ